MPSIMGHMCHKRINKLVNLSYNSTHIGNLLSSFSRKTEYFELAINCLARQMDEGIVFFPVILKLLYDDVNKALLSAGSFVY